MRFEMHPDVRQDVRPHNPRWRAGKSMIRVRDRVRVRVRVWVRV
jgi:hypothetical protein